MQCSNTGMKTTLFLLNPRCYQQTDSPLQHPVMDLSNEADECDPCEVWTLWTINWIQCFTTSVVFHLKSLFSRCVKKPFPCFSDTCETVSDDILTCQEYFLFTNDIFMTWRWNSLWANSAALQYFNSLAHIKTCNIHSVYWLASGDTLFL